MRKLTIVVGLLAAVAFAGCKKDEGGKQPEAAKTADAAAPKVEADAASGGGTGGGGGEPGPGGPGSGTGGGQGGGGSMGGTGTMGSKMANCPSAVEGATTTVADGKDAVEVTVVAKDKKATEEIRARSKKLAEASKTAAPAEVKHSGTGTGGGEIGFCPVVLKDTTVEYAEVKGGAKLTVKPAKPEDLAALSAESKRRNENMPKGGAAPAPAEGGDKPAGDKPAGDKPADKPADPAAPAPAK
jgi:hypothetical protein